ncbi:MAG TPA: 1-acyl-sn-glycerol-3-phosphate acyltransferase [Anaerolineales bacterium]|nr:1-acyl-sn-glycerol-3-phosphate acyltransferase [Anaerolineales bacterium]
MNSPTFTLISKTLKVVAALVLLASAWEYRTSISEALGIFSNPQAILDYLRGLGSFGLAILFVLVLVQLFVAFLPGYALAMAAGAIYGAPTAIAVTASSAILGSQAVFWLSRKYGRPFIYRLAPQPMIDRWDRIAGDRGPLFYFFTFVLPFLPSDMMCYVAGLGKISGRKFFIANFGGRLLSTIAITLIGAYQFHPPLGFWILFAGCIMLLTLAWGIYDKTLQRLPKTHDLAWMFGMALSNLYRNTLGIKYNIEGLENLPRGPKILAANHPGASDSALLPPVFGEQVIGLAEAGQFKNPIIGWILEHGGHIPVHTEQAHKAFDLAIEALSNGKTILIFPEGTLNPKHEDMQAKSGAVRLALRTGAPIIPIGIHVPIKDALNLRWYSKNGRGHGGYFQFRGQYSVRIGHPWRPDKGKANIRNPFEVRELTQGLMNQIHTLIRQAAQAGPK